MSRPLLLDTNLMLFYLVMTVDLSLLSRFKRVSGFHLADVQLLRDLVRHSRGLWTTPHVLTEVSNFVGQAPQGWRLRLVVALGDFAREQEERYTASSALVDMAQFGPLGMTDTALLALSGEATVATLDYELFERISHVGGYAVHFNHVRRSANA